MKYQQFVFKNYNFDAKTKRLDLHYSLDDQLNFTETYTFEFEFADYDPQVLDCALQSLFIMAGVSYYKTFLPSSILLQRGNLTAKEAGFFAKTYQKGLGELFYVNQLNPKPEIKFPGSNKTTELCESPNNQGLLIGIGGGKDSLLSVELLRQQPDLRLATWSLGHRSQLEPLIQTIGLPHLWVDRQWDRQLLDLNQQDAYNGHVPLSAILAATGVVVAALSGYRDVVVSNESSASEPNLTYQGVAINHQYSKSLEFEHDFQTHLHDKFGDALRYYSFLRPITEVHIAELFAKYGFDKYHDVFSSCNRAFIHSSHQMSWCGVCPKCAFVFLALTPFLPREKVESLWGGKNLLLDPSLQPLYRNILGIEGNKPLECVGEVKESRAAMRLAQKQYPEIANLYQFDLPTDYDYKALSPHGMPPEAFAILHKALEQA